MTTTEEWNPFPTPTEMAQAPAVAQEHVPVFQWRQVPDGRKVGVVGHEFREHLVESQPEGYTPPFWCNKNGTLVSERTTTAIFPGCPPIEVGGKALVLDDWGNPQVMEVTGIRGGEITGKISGVHMQFKAWLAMNADAPLSDGGPDESNLLSEEEAAALEAELFEWSKFLGRRAEKYGWCSTFESILNDVGVKPWRPPYKSVTLQVYTRISADKIRDVVKEGLNGEADLPDTVTVTAHVTLENIDRETYDKAEWRPLLDAKGYTNYSDIYVLSKEMADL